MQAHRATSKSFGAFWSLQRESKNVTSIQHSLHMWKPKGFLRVQSLSQMVISSIVLLLPSCDNMPWLFTLLQITDCHIPSFAEVTNWLISY
jgi:hypothetical protein